jgi:CBS-domain-containing membrane protein
MMHRRINAVMSAPAVSVTADTPFKEVAELLAEHRISGLPVVDAQNRVLGVISETDLLARQVDVAEEWQRTSTGHRSHLPGAARRAAVKARATTAEQLMTTPAVTAHPDGSVVAAARTMATHRVERLPVVDDRGRLVGIVSRRDLVSVFVRPDADIRAEIVDEVLVRALWLAPHAITVDVSDGLVTLTGEMERSSQVAVARRMADQVDGVVAVECRLTSALDDRHLRISPETREWMRTL